MFCLACQEELEDNFRLHYKTDLHAVNVLRKIEKLAPLYELPVTQSIDTENNFKKEKSPKIHENFAKFECFVCTNIENDNLMHIEHLKTHEIEIIDYELMDLYIENNKCLFCEKFFLGKKAYRNHINCAHLKKNDGKLSKIIDYKEFSIPKTIESNNQKKNNNQIQLASVFKNEVKNLQKVRNAQSKQRLKVSLKMNVHKHYIRPNMGA